MISQGATPDQQLVPSYRSQIIPKAYDVRKQMQNRISTSHCVAADKVMAAKPTRHFGS